MAEKHYFVIRLVHRFRDAIDGEIAQTVIGKIALDILEKELNYPISEMEVPINGGSETVEAAPVDELQSSRA